ncbi:MAG: rhomboid family intramembrane serine protease [Thermoleophilia bacterium]
MSSPPNQNPGLPDDFEARYPDDIDVRTCYRHPDRETGVSCSNCGRPICHECMIPAPVGFHCPECVKGSRRGSSRGKVVTRGQMRARWGSGGGALGGTAPVTRILIIINVAVFLLEVLLGAMTFTGNASSTLNSMGALVPSVVAEGQYWRLFTAMFLHAGIFHLGFNMWALYIGGSFLEMLAGRTKFLLIYFISGLAGNVAVYLLSAPSAATIGASTAIFGVFGALFLYSVHFHETAAGRALRSMGSVIAINLLITFLIPGISWQGHVGGLIGGMAAVEVLTQFGRRDLAAPFTWRDGVLVAGIAVALAALVVWRTGALA